MVVFYSLKRHHSTLIGTTEKLHPPREKAAIMATIGATAPTSAFVRAAVPRRPTAVSSPAIGSALRSLRPRFASDGRQGREGEVLDGGETVGRSGGVDACGGERDGGVEPGPGAGGRQDEHGGDGAELGDQQQPVGVDITGCVCPHLGSLLCVHFHSGRRR
ncbi:hypothetical protein GW17_00055263 [Ensete ventricosum]|nr:hypothetical protein GW17_00055263 [Ensete ventricosum]RZR88769.1 hypothetical protein BHM03_00016400 [Ensete ventricosum]